MLINTGHPGLGHQPPLAPARAEAHPALFPGSNGACLHCGTHHRHGEAPATREGPPTSLASNHRPFPTHHVLQDAVFGHALMAAYCCDAGVDDGTTELAYQRNSSQHLCLLTWWYLKAWWCLLQPSLLPRCVAAPFFTCAGSPCSHNFPRNALLPG